jgi:hypothetical protein
MAAGTNRHPALARPHGDFHAFAVGAKPDILVNRSPENVDSGLEWINRRPPHADGFGTQIQQGDVSMKHNSTMLTIASLLSILLLTLHITDDIVRGISKAESSNIALVVLVVLLYGTLVLPERRSGHVIMLLVGLLAAAMPVMHMRGAHYGEIAKSPGGFFFVWTLWALGGLGGFTFILSARGLWGLRRGQPR